MKKTYMILLPVVVACITAHAQLKVSSTGRIDISNQTVINIVLPQPMGLI